MKHEMQLCYTTDDDGTHLWCPDCGTDVKLDFNPTVEQAAAAQEAHLEEIAPTPAIHPNSVAQRSWTEAGYPGSPPA